ncbi:hypothetical protein ACFLRF_04720 [Candidatus Altiarchaeota archaeon]
MVLLLIASSYGLWILLSGHPLRAYASFIPLLLSLQVLLNDLLEHHVMGGLRFGSFFFKLLMAPGTMLHELSHFFAALFTGSTITGLSLFKPNPRTGMLGSVSYKLKVDEWVVVREFLIAFAPFMGCGIMILLVDYFYGGMLLEAVGGLDVNAPDDFIQSFIILSTSIFGFMAGLDYASISSWIILYAIFSFSLGAAPSGHDFRDSLKSMVKYPVGTVFTVFFISIIFLVHELPYSLYGVREYVSGGSLLAFKFVFTVLMFSCAFLALMLPIAYVFSVLKGQEKKKGA